jgi:putative transposase
MTLDELERWLALEIVGRYHNTIHGSLLISPDAGWRSAVERRPAPFRHPRNEEQFLHDFLPFEERSIRRDGVHLFGLRYWDDVLSPWASRLGRRLRVKYDPRDLSCVFVEGPDGMHWPIRYADLGRPRITLGEHRLALAALKRRGIRLIDEQVIFDAIQAQRKLLEDASSATRSARRQVERQARSLKAADRATDEAAMPAPEVDPTTLPILAVEEWS